LSSAPAVSEGDKVRFKRPIVSVNNPPVRIKRGTTGTVVGIGPAWDLPLATTYVGIALDGGAGEVTLPLTTCLAILAPAT
jgi:hypothetical protein